MAKYVVVKPLVTRGIAYNVGDYIDPKDCMNLKWKLNERRIVMIDEENPESIKIASYHLNHVGLNVEEYIPKKKKTSRKPRKPKVEKVGDNIELEL